MSTVPADVSRATTAYFEGVPMEVVMAYWADDPWAVTFVFDPLGLPRKWVFSRDLLAECFAFRSTFARHDVVVDRLSTRDLRVRLGGKRRVDGKEAVSLFTFPLVAVREFLGQTVRVVPFGQESRFVDWTEAEAVFRLPPGALSGVPSA